jgi:hypothetical protein
MFQNHRRIARWVFSVICVTRIIALRDTAWAVGGPGQRGLANPGVGRSTVVVRASRMLRPIPVLCRRVLCADQFFGASVRQLREKRLNCFRSIDSIVLVIDRQSLLAEYPES